MKGFRYPKSLFQVLLLALSVSPQFLNAQRRGESPPPPAPLPCLTFTQRLSLADVIGLLEKVLDNTMTFPCIEEKISKQGVSFVRIPVVEDTLKDFGATPAIIARIPPPPPPPAPKFAGPLTVTCSSPECEVYVGGKHQTTRGGQTVIGELLPGKVALAVYKEGFKLYSADMDLIDGVPKTAAVQLQQVPPDPSIPALKQKGLLWDMVAATGRIDKFDGMGTLSRTGGDKNLSWEIPKLAMNPAKDLDITFKNSAGECKLKITGQTSKPASCSKFKNDAPVDVVAAAKLFARYQLGDVVGELAKRTYARSDGTTESLQTEGGADSFVVTLNAEGLPAKVEHHFQNNQVTVQYSNYMKFNEGQIPLRMVIEEATGMGKWEFEWSPVRPR